MKKNLGVKIGLLLLCSLCLSPTSVSYASSYTPPATSVVMPMQAFQQLSSNNKQLVLKLAELEMQLAELKRPSEQLTVELKKSKDMLAVAKKQLAESQAALLDAKKSLSSVKDLQQTANVSLQELKQNIEVERRRQKEQANKLRRQRNIYLAAACLLAFK